MLKLTTNAHRCLSCRNCRCHVVDVQGNMGLPQYWQTPCWQKYYFHSSFFKLLSDNKELVICFNSLNGTVAKVSWKLSAEVVGLSFNKGKLSKYFCPWLGVQASKSLGSQTNTVHNCSIWSNLKTFVLLLRRLLALCGVNPLLTKKE